MNLQATARIGVAIDIALRCCVPVVIGLLVREFWREPESGTDGMPVRLLIAPLAAYLVWNIMRIGRSLRSWTGGAIVDQQFLAAVGALSVARLVWLVPLANDLWYRHQDPLSALSVASVACTVLTMGAALRIAASRADPWRRDNS